MKAIAFMPNATIDERVEQLKKICHSESEETYNRTLTDSEIEREKTDYVDNGIRLKDVEVEASAGAEPLGIGFEKPKPDIEDAEYEEVKNETQAESETDATETQETGKKPRKNSDA